MTDDQVTFLLDDPSLSSNRIVVSESVIQTLILNHLKTLNMSLPEEKIVWIWRDLPDGNIDLVIVTPPEVAA